jgi:hypothetical protein
MVLDRVDAFGATTLPFRADRGAEQQGQRELQREDQSAHQNRTFIAT